MSVEVLHKLTCNGCEKQETFVMNRQNEIEDWNGWRKVEYRNGKRHKRYEVCSADCACAIAVKAYLEVALT